MNPGYCIFEGSPDRQRKGTSKQWVLGMVKLPFESNFKQITHHYQSNKFSKMSTNSKNGLQKCIIINLKHALTRET